MDAEKIRMSNSKPIHEQLDMLYSKRDAIENLIRCLESYAECLAKSENSQGGSKRC